MNAKELQELGTELFGLIENGEVKSEGLAQVTSSPKWDNENAKAIGVQQWVEVWALAQIIHRTVDLPKPTPGADPKGFMWLTWEKDGRKFALEIHPGLLVRHMYEWTTTDMGIPTRHKSVSLRGVVEGLRSLFGKGDVRAA